MKRYNDDCQLIYDIPCKIEPKFATYNMLLYAEKVIDGAHRRLCVKRGRIKSSAAFRTLLTLLARSKSTMKLQVNCFSNNFDSLQGRPGLRWTCRTPRRRVGLLLKIHILMRSGEFQGVSCGEPFNRILGKQIKCQFQTFLCSGHNYYNTSTSAESREFNYN